MAVMSHMYRKEKKNNKLRYSFGHCDTLVILITVTMVTLVVQAIVTKAASIAMVKNSQLTVFYSIEGFKVFIPEWLVR